MVKSSAETFVVSVLHPPTRLDRTHLGHIHRSGSERLRRHTFKRRNKVTQIHQKAGNLRAVQLLPK